MKGDKPSLQMVVDGGRLAPAGPFEAEVLATYPRGAVLTVDMHQRRSLPLLKKYWAVLRDVVDKCKTPWESPDEASDALKLALGVTDIGKTVTGKWFVRAGSISFNSMDQAAFRDFFDRAMALLARVTGIDPLDLDRRYAHIPEHEPSAAPVDDGGDGTPPVPTGAVAAMEPQEGGSTEEGDNPGAVASEQPAPSSGALSDDDRRFLCDVFKRLSAAVGPDVAILVNQVKGLKADMEGMSTAVRAKASTIRNKLEECCGEDPKVGTVQVRKYVAGLLGVDERELQS